jgi:hypothetical protein
MVYQDTIQPETQAMYDSIMHQIGLSQQGYYLEACFDHLPVLQDDEMQHAQTNKVEVDTYSIMLKDGIITPEQYASEFDIEIQPIDRTQSQQAALAQAQTNLKGTVGGLDGIIALNRSVGIGEMDRQTAVNTLISYYGYDSLTANSLITQPKEVIPPVTV